jgi:hypothetical protein
MFALMSQYRACDFYGIRNKGKAAGSLADHSQGEMSVAQEVAAKADPELHSTQLDSCDVTEV